MGSPGVVFAALGSPYAPSEGNLGVESRGKELVRSSLMNWGFRRGTRLVSRQAVRAVVARKRMAVERSSRQPANVPYQVMLSQPRPILPIPPFL